MITGSSLVIGSSFPRQQLSFKRKNAKWGQACVDWAAEKNYFSYAPVRSTVVRMKINYDLLNGKIHMKDVADIINPNEASAMFQPDKIQHYPIMNSKLNVLRGEAYQRVFDFRAIVTNPDAISSIEEKKMEEFRSTIQGLIEDPNLDQQQLEQETKDVLDFYQYNWQDVREIRANEILNYYTHAQNLPDVFNDGFMDAMTVGEEIYQVDIVGGEPVVVRLNPLKLRVFRAGFSNKIEDADVIAYEDYWPVGKIIDAFYDQLKPSDIKWLEGRVTGDDQELGAAGNYNDAYGYIPSSQILGEDGVIIESDEHQDYFFDALNEMDGGFGSSLMPYDMNGNVRVIRVYWKSRRMIKKVKSYDPETGEETFDFYPETYIIDKDKGEEEEIFWVNEPWEGTRIGKDIYVNVRPRIVKYNSLDNPSRCHFGIIGTIYNLNESRPFSLVDMMKPYNYLYDAVHAKMVDLIASNWGKILEMDMSLKPKDWAVEKWIYQARVNKILLKDSFNEGTKGAATGKLAGGLNNASKGMIDAEVGNSIQYNMELCEFIKNSMSDLVGISRQREGNIANRETVGGVERSTLQSSYITEWLFQKHDDTIKRVLTALLETAKVAYMGRTMTFRYMLSDGSIKMFYIDGDEFCENSYGILVENSSDTMKLDSKIETYAQAALQNGRTTFAALMKINGTKSISQKIRILEMSEKQMVEQQQQQAQQEQQTQLQIEQMRQQLEQLKLQQQDMLNQRDNDTRIEVAKINSQAEYLRLGVYAEENDEEIIKEKYRIEREKLEEEKRQFDQQLEFKRKELEKKMEVEKKKITAQKSKPAGSK